MIKFFKKNTKLDLLIAEKVFKYFNENRLGAYITIFIIFFSSISLSLPYVNLFVNLNLLWPLVFFLLFFILKVEIRVGVVIITILFFLSPFYVILKMEDVAEFFGNINYFLILAIWIKLFLTYRKKLDERS